MSEDMIIIRKKHSGHVDVAWYKSFDDAWDAYIERSTSALYIEWDGAAARRELFSLPGGEIDEEEYQEDLEEIGITDEYEGKILEYSYGSGMDSIICVEGDRRWVTREEFLTNYVCEDLQWGWLYNRETGETDEEFVQRVSEHASKCIGYISKDRVSNAMWIS